MSKRYLFSQVVFLLYVFSFCFSGTIFALEQTITIPAEKSEGVTLNLEKGDYVVRISAGAITLFYPINPRYCWLIGVAVGSGVEGGQDEPNLGTLYFEPDPAVYSQAEAEQQALAAVKKNKEGTFLNFTLKENSQVRFWVSDFDYTDNSGLIKLNIRKR